MKTKKIIGTLIWILVIAGAAAGITAIIRHNRNEAMRSSAVSLYQQGQYEEAIELFSRFDDENAAAWVRRCREGIADREAGALRDAGRLQEALELLNEENPDSGLLPDIALERAKQLVAQGEPEAALVILQSAPQTREIEMYLDDCEKAADEKRFFSLLDEGRTGEALALFNERRAELTDVQRAQWSEAYQKAEASKQLENGQLFSAFKRYEELSDEAGMAAVLDAMEAAGDYLMAFRCVAETSAPDPARLDVLFDRLPASDTALVSNTGQLENGNVYFGPLLGKLLAAEDGTAAALAEKIADRIVGECRARLDAGERCVPYSALGELEKWAGKLWTEELEALKDGCTEEMPENGVMRDPSGLQARSGATVTVQTGERGVILTLNALTTPDPVSGRGEATGKALYVFVRPHSRFSFTVAAGWYSASALLGRVWFGESEGFGLLGTGESVRIDNSIYTQQLGERLEGSYSLTLD